MLRHPHKEGFLAAANKEYSDLERRNTFRVVKLTTAIPKLLPLMWVFTYKFDDDDYLIKYKARIVARGDLQATQHQDTYAATLAARSFRAIMAIAAAFDLEVHQWDAVNAFINSNQEETVYCDNPEGFDRPGMCLLLLQALYGLRTSPLLWLKELSSTLRGLGLQRTDEDVCIFQNDWLLVFFYVDDIATLYQTIDLRHLYKFRDSLYRKYEMRYIGQLRWFLGIRVIRDRKQRKIWLYQDSYIEKINNSFNLQYMKPARIPMNMEEL